MLFQKKVMIQNLCKENPTLLNGVELKGKTQLNDGDSFSIAYRTFVFRDATYAKKRTYPNPFGTGAPMDVKLIGIEPSKKPSATQKSVKTRSKTKAPKNTSQDAKAKAEKQVTSINAEKAKIQVIPTVIIKKDEPPPFKTPVVIVNSPSPLSTESKTSTTKSISSSQEHNSNLQQIKPQLQESSSNLQSRDINKSNSNKNTALNTFSKSVYNSVHELHLERERALSAIARGEKVSRDNTLKPYCATLFSRMNAYGLIYVEGFGRKKERGDEPTGLPDKKPKISSN